MQKHEINCLPSTLAAARAVASNKYYTGKPCKYGHDTYRYTKDRACAGCVKQKVKRAATIGGGNTRRWAAKTPEQLAAIYAKRKEYYKKTREVRITERKNSYERLKQNEAWVAQRKEYNRAYRKTPNAAAQHKADTVQRRISAKCRTPLWADLAAIVEFYNKCPTGYHVDHVLPLRGKYVSGLHTLENLQYLRAEDNLRKNNRYIPK